MPKQILLVDDSVTVQRVVEITFAREDAKVTIAQSADEALAKAREQKPDLVLIDAALPGKNGYELTTALRSDPAFGQTAVLLLTGNFAPYDEAKGQAAGADGFAVKPFETQALIDKSNDAISRRGGGKSAASPVAAPPPASTPATATPAPPPRPPSSSTTPGMAPTMTMPAPVLPTTPAAPKPAAPVSQANIPTPVATPIVKSKDDEIGFGDLNDPPKPATPPAAAAKPQPPAPTPPKPAAPPAPVAPPKPASPPANPTASTMMMEAPKLPTSSPTSSPSGPTSPPANPTASTMMMEAPKLPTAAPAPRPPGPPTKPPPRATILGMPVIAPPNPGTPPSPAIPAPPTIPAPVAVKAPEPTKSEPKPEPKPEAKAPEPPKPAPKPPETGKVLEMPSSTASAANGRKKVMPADVPKMPRPSLLAGVPQPQPKAKAEPGAPKAELPAQPTPRRQLPRDEASPLVSALVERAQAQVVEQLSGQITAKVPGGEANGDTARVSREVIERIAWEVVPELAEVIIKEHLDKLAANRGA